MSETIVLIDDDPIIAKGWAEAAVPAGINLITYLSPLVFLENASLFHKTVRIYIDSDLDQVKKGEEWAQDFFKLGFKNIHLLLAYDFDQKRDIPSFVEEVISKAPPF